MLLIKCTTYLFAMIVLVRLKTGLIQTSYQRKEDWILSLKEKKPCKMIVKHISTPCRRK